ncbi:MAG TPA: proton-conducting transporter membrane subunit [Phycisphaerae bacterium]|nr:proton-conducting transporter membrane subunit [Phycisphaerae bacterium]HUT60910.1 proton-conducting transporter membrane subunit [Phycisphaerae bacterium]
MQGIVPLLVVLPLVVAFGIVILVQVRVLRGLPVILACFAMLANLIVSLCLLGVQVDPIFVGGWGPAKTLGIQLTCDGMAKLMLVTINLVAFASVLFATSYIRRFTKPWLFYSLFLLMTGAMNAVVLAGDLFNLFVFLEVAAIASYALVAFGCESEELEASFKYLVLGSVGSVFILMGVAILYSLTGHLNMAMVHEALRALREAGPVGPAVLLAAAALIAGLALKAAMVPFHAWLPDAHPSAPAPISAMLSGVLIKASGVYALARIVFSVLGAQSEYAVILISLGAASMVIGALLSIGQWDFKRLLAYSSISQVGYVVLAIGVAAHVVSGPEPNRAAAGLCLFGGLFHLFNHAAFKSLLFLSSGSIEQQSGTRMLKEMGGLTRRMPVTSFCCRIGAMSIAGVPPFNGFFSKLIIVVALAMAGYVWLSALAVAVAVVTLLIFVKVQRYVLEGEPGPKVAAAREAPAMMCVGLVILAVVCVASGLAMVFLREQLFDPASSALLDTAKTITMGATP